MKVNKKLLSTVGAAAILASGSASAVVVGGVDFGTLGETSHLETTTLAETLVLGDGDILTGYGQVNTVNGNNAYAGSDLLYFVFNYETVDFSATSTGFINGTVDLYLGNAGNLLLSDSATNITTIEALTPWATLSGHADASGHEITANGLLTGSILTFLGGGLLDVTGGMADVVSYLDTDDISDGIGGFADIQITTSGSNGVLNPNDDTTGCKDGTASAGQWCIAGSADLRGSTHYVPEPSVLGLLGMGLLGFGITNRKRKAA